MKNLNQPHGFPYLRKHFQKITEDGSKSYNTSKESLEIITTAAKENPSVWLELQTREETLRRLVRETGKRRVKWLLSCLRNSISDLRIPQSYKHADLEEITRIIQAEGLTYAEIDTTSEEFSQLRNSCKKTHH